MKKLSIGLLSFGFMVSLSLNAVKEAPSLSSLASKALVRNQEDKKLSSALLNSYFDEFNEKISQYNESTVIKAFSEPELLPALLPKFDEFLIGTSIQKNESNALLVYKKFQHPLMRKCGVYRFLDHCRISKKVKSIFCDVLLADQEVLLTNEERFFIEEFKRRLNTEVIEEYDLDSYVIAAEQKNEKVFSQLKELKLGVKSYKADSLREYTLKRKSQNETNTITVNKTTKDIVSILAENKINPEAAAFISTRIPNLNLIHSDKKRRLIFV